MKYYDFKNKRLLYLTDYKINQNFWDNLWVNMKIDLRKNVLKFNPKSMVCKITRRYLLPSNGPILEGGCGLGDKVYSLQKLGYKVIGIDTAKTIIKKLHEEIPEIEVKVGDVREIQFSNDFFAGYWSLGVIEHFYEGYDEIAKEMLRVIKFGGYLFLTFPYMSPIRRFKAKSNLYNIYSEKYKNSIKIKKIFYQFALDKNEVINNFEMLGFTLVSEYSEDGIIGFKQEIFFLKFFIKKFLDLVYNIHKPEILRILKQFINRFLAKFSGHIIVLVFQKKN